MNSATSLKDLRQFIDLADKFNLDEYAGAEGMYKLCYIIGNRLLRLRSCHKRLWPFMGFVYAKRLSTRVYRRLSAFIAVYCRLLPFIVYHEVNGLP